MNASIEMATKELYRLAERAPFNIAPEKGKKLAAEIFGSEKWIIRSSYESANFFAVPTDNTIYLSYAGLASLWCLSYACFQIANIATIRQQQEKVKTKEEKSIIDIGPECQNLQVFRYIDYARTLFTVNCDWPSGLCKPNVNDHLSETEESINDLFFGALGWIMLHEIAHIYNEDVKHTSPTIKIRQEYRADDFATRWIFENAGVGRKNEFRILAVSIALSWLFLQEDTVGPSGSHPRAILRFREAKQHFNFGKRSFSAEYAGYFMKAIFHPKVDAPQFKTSKDFFMWVCKLLEQKFSSN